MILVLRKSTVRRTLAIATLMILVGISLSNPFMAQATTPSAYLNTSPFAFYLYPMPQNNPISLNGMFWSEDHPALGYAPLSTWERIAKGKQIAIGIPRTMDASRLDNVGNKIGNYLKNKIKGQLNNGRYDKDVFKYKRTIDPDHGVTDEITVEIGRHFRDNRNFEDFAGTVKNHLVTDVDIESVVNPRDEVPAPAPTPEAAKAVGNTLILGGVALMLLKLLPLLAL